MQLNRRVKLLSIICIIIVILIIGTLIIVNVGMKNETDGEKFKNEYEKLNNQLSEDGKEYPKMEISSDNIIKYIDVEELFEMFRNNNDAVIYLGYPSCTYCRHIIGVLFDVAEETGIDTIYYLNVSEVKDNYDELVNQLDTQLSYLDYGSRKIYVPLVLFMVNGNIVSYNKGTMFSHDDPYKKLDEFQIKSLKLIYKYGINDVLSSANE